MFLVLCVLPSILVLGDSIIERTQFNVQPVLPQTQETSGRMRVRGYVHGEVAGRMDGYFEGYITGHVNLSVSSDGEMEVEAKENEQV